MLPGLLDRADRRLDVAQVVERVEHAKDIHAVPGGGSDKGLDDVVGKVGVLHDVLAAQQHRLRSFRREALHRVEPVKREFGQKTQPGIDRCAAPRFQGAEANGVELGRHSFNLLGRHASGGQRLVSVAQDSVVEDYGNSTHGWVKPDNMRGPNRVLNSNLRRRHPSGG